MDANTRYQKAKAEYAEARAALKVAEARMRAAADELSAAAEDDSGWSSAENFTVTRSGGNVGVVAAVVTGGMSMNVGSGVTKIGKQFDAQGNVKRCRWCGGTGMWHIEGGVTYHDGQNPKSGNYCGQPQ